MNLIELAQKLRPIIEKASQSLDDKTALEAVTLFPKWSVSIDYSVGDKVRYNDVLRYLDTIGFSFALGKSSYT